MGFSSALVLSLALPIAAAVTPREALAAEVNAAQTTWVAHVGSDRDKPLHSSSVRALIAPKPL